MGGVPRKIPEMTITGIRVTTNLTTRVTIMTTRVTKMAKIVTTMTKRVTTITTTRKLASTLFN